MVRRPWHSIASTPGRCHTIPFSSIVSITRAMLVPPLYSTRIRI